MHVRCFGNLEGAQLRCDRSGGIGPVDHTRVGLAELHLGDDPLHVLLVARDVGQDLLAVFRAEPWLRRKPIEHLAGVLTHRNRFGRDHHLRA